MWKTGAEDQSHSNVQPDQRATVIDVLLFRETDRPRHGDNETYANAQCYRS
jgi:hypothetical protein